ncbi:MAG: hypothetical protein NTZ63_02190 [Candidatus Omnitrophica bacterium]|nr:hypothetical protein [Candidatus Omnitrophota bacterium]
MNILVAILLVGLSGIVAQVLILRELLVSFQGNELTIGIILANWVILEALGVYVIGKLVDKIKARLSFFIVMNTIFSLILPVAIYYSRIFKTILGIPFAEGISLPVIFSVSFLIILPLAFLHGGLFSCGCKVYSLKKPENSLGKIYTWETLGTIIGGALLTYALIPNFNSFQTVFIISFLNLVVSVQLIPKRNIKHLATAVVILIFVLFSRSIIDNFQSESVKKQWSNQQVLNYQNSSYANIVVTKKLEQYTFFYNGIPIIISPYPDKQFVKEFGNLPLLFSPSPQKVLLAGSGAGGLIAEILQYPIKRLDYVEIDPIIIEKLKKYSTALTVKEFSDGRIKIVNTDPKLFLRDNKSHYDVIMFGFSNQSDLSSNRYFTTEFFALAKQHLNPGGLLALWMPGSLAYMSQELKDLNASVLNSLRFVNKYVRVIPGDCNIFIASDSSEIMQVSSKVLSERIFRNNIPQDILIPKYLEYRLSNDWVDWFNRQMSGATKEQNRDLRPLAVFQTLMIINKKFSAQFSRVFDYFEYVNLKISLIMVLLIVLGVCLVAKLRRSQKIPVAYAIFTTGFFGMLVNLLLIFAYQAFYGSLYQNISMLTAIFMAGIAAGSILISAKLAKLKNALRTLIKLEILIAVFSFSVGYFIVNFAGFVNSTVFYLLFFISGMLMGLEFPLAGKLYSSKEDKVGSTSGVLYACDLIGGWLAGIFAGVVFLPILGFFNACLLIVAFKLSSLLLLGTLFDPK